MKNINFKILFFLGVALIPFKSFSISSFAWEGNWSFHHREKDSSGSVYRYDGKLYISKCDSNSCHYSIWQGDTNATCEKEGTFFKTALDLAQDSLSKDKQTCVILFKVKQKRIFVETQGENCNEILGCRTGLGGESFSK